MGNRRDDIALLRQRIGQPRLVHRIAIHPVRQHDQRMRAGRGFGVLNHIDPAPNRVIQHFTRRGIAERRVPEEALQLSFAIHQRKLGQAGLEIGGPKRCGRQACGDQDCVFHWWSPLS